jgi:hypothetical protein
MSDEMDEVSIPLNYFEVERCPLTVRMRHYLASIVKDDSQEQVTGAMVQGTSYLCLLKRNSVTCYKENTVFAVKHLREPGDVTPVPINPDSILRKRDIHSIFSEDGELDVPVLDKVNDDTDASSSGCAYTEAVDESPQPFIKEDCSSVDYISILEFTWVCLYIIVIQTWWSRISRYKRNKMIWQF